MLTVFLEVLKVERVTEGLVDRGCRKLALSALGVRGTPSSDDDRWCFNVSRPMMVVVLKDWVTLTKVTLVRSNTSTSLANSISE